MRFFFNGGSDLHVNPLHDLHVHHAPLLYFKIAPLLIVPHIIRSYGSLSRGLYVF